MIEQGLQLAQRTHEALEKDFAKRGTRVVVLARAGQDLSKYKLSYSHLGLAYRAPLANGTGRWLIAHKLNTCGTDVAALYLQGVGEFFLDDPHRFEAAWVVPTPELQGKLHSFLQNNANTARMHTKPYSMVSYAWATKYQQSNQWAIETMAAAFGDNVRSRKDAQAWLQAKNYIPTTLNIPPLTRLGGRMTQANVAFDDHPAQKRFSDRIESVTVDSVFDWMIKGGLSGPIERLN
jgi:hypothetical protein